MPDIQVLSPHVADLIAAGEVVERPASVAKELMENAIDAGADKVTVEISHGGMTLIRVTDNGCGIPASQLATAFLRHATSKLRTEYDLEAIGTLGFRGEALAAISAVSRIDVMSCPAGGVIGASLHLEGGVPGPVEEAGCPPGTTMVVRDLFYNTPARLKFMKKDAAEGAAVFSAVQRLALSHPEVRVTFLRDGRQEMQTPGDGQLQSAVYAVLGREFALGFVPVKGSGEEMEVTGFASRPACCRGSRSYQHFFVNGRYVRSPLLTAAVEEAYANQKMVGKFPGCVIHLRTKLNAVDVNVHPTKMEVKFGQERQVFSAVYHAVLSALEGDRVHPGAVLERPRPHDMVTPNQTRLSPPAAPPVRAGGSLPLHDWTRSGRASPAPAAPKAGTPSRVSPPVSVRADQPIPAVPAAPVPIVSPVQAPPAVSGPQERRIQPPAPAESTEKAEPCPAPAPVRQEEPPVEQQPPAQPEASWRVAGEVLNTYIIVEQGDRVLFIDKHAAHERMNFDRMKAQGYDPMAQALLAPAVCRLAPEEHAALLSHLPLLEEFGFQAEEFGPGTLAVRQAPFDVDAEEIEGTLSQIARKLLTTGSADPSAARDEVMHTMACKAAIKGGWHTTPQELERVAREVMEGRVKYCPHGRPVAIELTRKELEKQFRRS